MMAKDPKNFTGEDVPALLAAAKERERAKGEWKLVGGFAVVVIGVLLVAGGIFGSLFSLLR